MHLMAPADEVETSYLWPGYNDDASDFHVLLMAMVVNVKRREHLETWSAFFLYLLAVKSL